MLALYLGSSFEDGTRGAKAGFHVVGRPFAEGTRKARPLHGMTEYKCAMDCLSTRLNSSRPNVVFGQLARLVGEI